MGDCELAEEALLRVGKTRQAANLTMQWAVEEAQLLGIQVVEQFVGLVRRQWVGALGLSESQVWLGTQEQELAGDQVAYRDRTTMLHLVGQVVQSDLAVVAAVAVPVQRRRVVDLGARVYSQAEDL